MTSEKDTDKSSKQEKSIFMTRLMTPDMSNFSGKVHGGTILKLLDEGLSHVHQDTVKLM